MTHTGNASDSDDVRIFVGDTSGPDNFVCFFEDTGESGDLYVSDRTQKKIVNHLQVYVDLDNSLGVQENDVQVLWSADRNKCGVVIWGGMRGIIDTETGRTIGAPLHHRGSPPIQDPQWLDGFKEFQKDPNG